MSDAQRVTKGPWRVAKGFTKGPRVLAAGGVVCNLSVRNSVPSAGVERRSYDQAVADAELIAEAGTVLHETGATPRQILDGFKASIASNADLVKERDSLQRRVEELTEALAEGRTHD